MKVEGRKELTVRWALPQIIESAFPRMKVFSDYSGGLEDHGA